MRWLRAAAVLSLVPPAGSAQAPAGATLRFHPAAGSLMRTQTDVEVTTTYVGLPAVPDSETATLSMRLLVSRRPQSPRPGASTISLTLDSARAISRFDNQGRKDVVLPYDGTAVAFDVDDAMALTVGRDAAAPSDTARRNFVAAVAPAFMLPLPRTAAVVGITWTADQSLPLGDLLPGGVPGAVTGPRALTAHVAARVDSLVPRGVDTLAYVSYAGTVEPVQSMVRDTSGVTALTVSGAVAASEIWSTAWNGWVSGGMRTRAVLKLHAANTDAVISADITARMQVRP